MLVDKEVEGNNLALLLNVNHFIAELRDAVDIAIGVCYVLVGKFAVSDSIQKFLQDLSNEVKKYSTAVTWNFLL